MEVPLNDDVSVVDIRNDIYMFREANLNPKMQVRISNQELQNLAKIEEVSTTISIIETVETFEPEFVETVNIVYASDASSCSTPVLDDRDDFIERETNSIERSFDDLTEELESETIQNSSIENESDSLLMLLKKRDIQKDSEIDNKTDSKKPRRNIAPTLKEILSYPERDSFYGSDKENFDDPLVFSEDEDIPRFSLEMNQDVDSDSDTVFCYFFFIFCITSDPFFDCYTSIDYNKIHIGLFQGRIETPTSAKLTDRQNKFPDLTASSMTSKNSISLDQRVFEFDKTAKYMIKKLDATRETIEKCDDGPDTIEHLKLSIAPDAATLISQGDTLVLETHGKSTELSATVMKTQSLLREKFREMKHSR